MESNKNIQKDNEIYDSMSLDAKQRMYTYFKENREEIQDHLSTVENLIYLKKPPTPEEFLDPKNGWLTSDAVDFYFKWVKDAFIEIMSNSEKYNIISFYGCTRAGKSELSRLIIYYTQVYINHLRDPKLYLGLSPKSNICQYFIAFNYNKSRQIILQPLFKNYFDASDRVVKVKFQDQVKEKQKELGPDYFVYSTATKAGEITTASGFNMFLGNKSPLSFIGADILQAFVTEIAFFIEDAGASEEQILRLFTDAVDRMKATMGLGKKLAFVLLDSSANRADSLIENHILNVLQKRDDVYFVSRSRWEIEEYGDKLFPRWKATGETFKVCTGEGSIPPKIIEHDDELENIPERLIIDVPIDSYNDFKDNLVKSIKDIAGRPSSDENRLIKDATLVNNIFNDNLDNIDSYLIADTSQDPKHLIWDQIKDKFFVKRDNDLYQLKRAYREPRYLAIDHAYASRGDMLGICCLHKEHDFVRGEELFIVDFCFALKSGKNEINLTSIEEFVYDLINEGNVDILSVSTDSFQNRQFKQNIERRNIKAIEISVDRSLDPYLFLLSSMRNNTVQSGKNIILKNNIFSLVKMNRKNTKTEKIDHSSGVKEEIYNGNWESSKCGINAKDVSDALCRCIWDAHNGDIVPITDFHIEQKKLSKKIIDSNVFLEKAITLVNSY